MFTNRKWANGEVKQVWLGQLFVNKQNPFPFSFLFSLTVFPSSSSLWSFLPLREVRLNELFPHFPYSIFWRVSRFSTFWRMRRSPASNRKTDRMSESAVFTRIQTSQNSTRRKIVYHTLGQKKSMWSFSLLKRCTCTAFLSVEFWEVCKDSVLQSETRPLSL